MSSHMTQGQCPLPKGDPESTGGQGSPQARLPRVTRSSSLVQAGPSQTHRFTGDPTFLKTGLSSQENPALSRVPRASESSWTLNGLANALSVSNHLPFCVSQESPARVPKPIPPRLPFKGIVPASAPHQPYMAPLDSQPAISLFLSNCICILSSATGLLPQHR